MNANVIRRKDISHFKNENQLDNELKIIFEDKNYMREDNTLNQ